MQKIKIIFKSADGKEIQPHIADVHANALYWKTEEINSVDFYWDYHLDYNRLEIYFVYSNKEDAIRVAKCFSSEEAIKMYEFLGYIPWEEEYVIIEREIL